MAGLSGVNASDLAAVELFNGYPPGLLNFATAACVIFMCIGIPGNLITIIALARYEKVRNATAIFIMNLSLSDLLFCCFILPLSGSTFLQRAWVYGDFLCHMFPLARYALVAVSLLTICAITINRYIMMAHPKLYPKLYKTRNIAIMIASIWIVSFGMLIPTWMGKWGRLGLDAKIGSCSIILDANNRSPKKVLFITAFGLTLSTIVICYARIFFIVRKTTKNTLKTNTIKNILKDEESSSAELSTSASMKLTKPDTSIAITERESTNSTNSTPNLQRTVTIKIEKRDAPKGRSDNKSEPTQLRRTALRKSMALLRFSLPTRKDRRLGTMILAIMISFCICHLPITITKLLRDVHASHSLNIAAYILLFLSSSFNPIIYVLMSNEYRKAYKNLLKRRRRDKLTIRA